ncbi:MAG: carbohydrate ABC transporter permease [Spirochaetales bacterium]|nr:carbohydrate ABC transporter permease [Spirochaetales bacterium]MBQ4500981.1 carbohydrate ABC transporter permease [Spirochaetales bacterium]MBQ6123774.1 carbohydrate ABC transporter permease [Spirochaetales bacterium]MBQ6578304.1 carbohydrate ABC transporter permease [Bacteroidales bacterium]
MVRRFNGVKRFFLYVLVVALAATMFFPIFWIFVTSVKSGPEVRLYPPTIWPREFHWENMSNAVRSFPLALWMRNTTIVAFAATAITVLINLLAGFAFAKYRFKGKGFLFMVVISTLMIPTQVIMVPSFVIVSRLRLTNTFLGLILPVCAEAFGLFMAKQFIEEIPDSLIESARIDGCSEFAIFNKVIVPNVKPLISLLVIYTVRWRWNDFQWPLIVINKKEMYTLQMGLKSISGTTNFQWNDLMALSLISLVPVAVVFLVFQKQFVDGAVNSGIKG